MAKDLRTFIADCERQLPGEVIHITKEVNPANYDVTAIIKHLGAQKKFPIIIFDNPLNLNGKVGPIKLTMNCEISQGKTQIALGMPRTATRPEMAEKCLEMEEHRVPPTIISKKDAPIKQNTMVGDKVDLYQIPIMRHHEMDGGPYIVLSTITKDRKSGIYNLSYHRMEVKSKNSTALYASPRHLWKIFKDYEDNNMEMPVATVLGHHPAFHMGACYSGPFEVSEYDVIGGYMGEPLRLVASETFGDDLLIPADAEVVIEGVLKPGGRVVEGPFGEAPGYLGPQRYTTCVHYEVQRDQLSQRRHVSVGDHAGRRQAVDGSAARRRVSAPLPRGGSGRHRGLQAGPPRALQCFHLDEKNVGRRSGTRRRRRVDLRPHQECLRLR